MGGRRRVRVFFNEKSGPGQVPAEELCRGFEAWGCPCEVTRVRRGLAWGPLAEADGADAVWVAAGGDGTVNAVASAIVAAGSGRAMGVLPVGTLNHFAKDLGMPLELQNAIEAISRGTATQVDAAEGAGFLFVNNSSLGFYPAMVLDRERMKKGGWNKWGSLVAASARAFWRFRCMEVDMEVEGSVRRCRTPIVFVGNNRYALGGGRIGRRERLDEGKMWVVLLPGATRLGMLKVLAAAVIGRVKELGELEEIPVERFSVRAKGRMRLRVAFDGEVRRMRGPIEYIARPGALRVIVPPGESR